MLNPEDRQHDDANSLHDDEVDEEVEDYSVEEEIDDADGEDEEPTPRRRVKKSSTSRSRRAKRSAPVASEEADEDMEDDGFTADQVLKINQFVQSRLDRERKQQEKKYNQRVKREREKWEQEEQERRQREEMTEAERLRTEKAEAERKAAEKVTQAERKLIRSEAKLVATELGVTDPKKRQRLFKLADFSEVELDDDGEPDYEAIEYAIKEVLEDIPELATKKQRPKAPEGESREASAEREQIERVQAARDAAVGSGSRTLPPDVDADQDVRNKPREEVAAALAKYSVVMRTPGQASKLSQ